MKPIKPIKVFFKDGIHDLDGLKVTSVFDNLVDRVTFKYAVFVDEEHAGGGEISLGPENYNTWDASASGAYQIVADAVGLELIENPNTWMGAPE